MILFTALMLLLWLLMSGLLYVVTGDGFLFWASAALFGGGFLLAMTVATAVVGWVALRDRFPVLARTMKLIWLRDRFLVLARIVKVIWPREVLGSVVVGGGAALIWWGLTTLRDAPSWFALSGSLAWVVLCVLRIAIPPEERAWLCRGTMASEERGEG